MPLACTIMRADGRRTDITLLSRLDTTQDVEYFRHGGLLNFAIRRRLN
jgi:aconitase A